MAWGGFAVLAAACSAPREALTGLERHEYTDAVMGVQARLVLYARSAQAASEGAEAAFVRLRELDAALSDWDARSELSRLVERAGEGPVPVGADLEAALALALRVAEASGGAFDPTVAPLVGLWRAARAAGRLPEPAELASARALVGWDRVVLDDARGTAALEPGTALDLGGVGKGFACDRALAVLRERGLSVALVDVGGDLALGDPPPGRAGWVVAAGCAEPRGRLVLARCGVATSGATEQFLEVDGVRYSHLVDPRTGLGTTHGRCVTVVAASGGLADALASALSTLDVPAGEALARRFGARVVVTAGSGGGGPEGPAPPR